VVLLPENTNNSMSTHSIKTITGVTASNENEDESVYLPLMPPINEEYPSYAHINTMYSSQSGTSSKHTKHDRFDPRKRIYFKLRPNQTPVRLRLQLDFPEDIPAEDTTQQGITSGNEMGDICLATISSTVDVNAPLIPQLQMLVDETIRKSFEAEKVVQHGTELSAVKSLHLHYGRGGPKPSMMLSSRPKHSISISSVF